MDKRQKFSEEFKNLLEKYNVDIEADDHSWDGCPGFGKDIRITISFNYIGGEDYCEDIEFRNGYISKESETFQKVIDNK